MGAQGAELRRVLIHAGMPKTGTTALQSFLSRNYERLRDRGILYPKAGRHTQPAHHAFFFSFLSGEPKFFSVDRPRFSSSEYLDQLHAEMMATQCPHLILSSEYLHSRLFTFAKLLDIKNCIPAREHTKLFYALRKPSEFLTSSYAQYIKGMQKGTLAPDRFLIEREKNGHFHYAGRIECFCQAFGHDDVHVAWYDQLRADVSGPLQQLAGFAVDETWAPPQADNRRPDWATLALLRLANRLPVGRERGRRAVMSLSERVPERLRRTYGDRLFEPFSAETLRRLDKTYADDPRAPSGATMAAAGEPGRPDRGEASRRS